MNCLEPFAADADDDGQARQGKAGQDHHGERQPRFQLRRFLILFHNSCSWLVFLILVTGATRYDVYETDLATLVLKEISIEAATAPLI